MKRKHVKQGGNGAKNNNHSSPPSQTSVPTVKRGRKKHGLWGPWQDLVRDRSAALKKALRKKNMRSKGLASRLSDLGKRWKKQDVRAYVLGKKMPDEEFLTDAALVLGTTRESLAIRDRPANIGLKGPEPQAAAEPKPAPPIETGAKQPASPEKHTTLEGRPVDAIIQVPAIGLTVKIACGITREGEGALLHVSIPLSKEQALDLLFSQ